MKKFGVYNFYVPRSNPHMICKPPTCFKRLHVDTFLPACVRPLRGPRPYCKVRFRDLIIRIRRCQLCRACWLDSAQEGEVVLYSAR